MESEIVLFGSPTLSRNSVQSEFNKSLLVICGWSCEKEPLLCKNWNGDVRA